MTSVLLVLLTGAALGASFALLTAHVGLPWLADALAFTAAGCALTAFGLVAGYTVRRARLPLREGRKRLSVDRQVQLIAGLMVLTGVGLGLAVSPWFLAVAAFFGAGLVFAGATGTCGLAFVLMKVPWNATPPLPTEGGGAVCAVGGGQAPTRTAAPRTQD